MDLHPWIHEIWIAATVLQVLLVGTLLVRRTWTRFPIFTAYATFNLCEAAVLFAVSKNGMLYFYTYWVCEAVAIMLGMAVVYEVFNGLLAPHAALKKIARMIFSGAVALLLLLGMIVVLTETSVHKYIFGSSVIAVAEAARTVEVGLLVFLFLFSGAFGLHWRAHVFGIALGLGIFVAVDLVNVTLRTHMHIGSGALADLLDLTKSAAFCMSVLIWSAYLFSPERVAARDAGSDEVPKTAQLEQWNQAVMELINR